MARLLLSHYANPHSRTTSGFTPRELAKDSEIIEMLANAEDTFLGSIFGLMCLANVVQRLCREGAVVTDVVHGKCRTRCCSPCCSRDA